VLEIGIIVGSTRPGRKAAAVARWVQAQAGTRTDARFTTVDIAEHPLDRLDEQVPAVFGSYEHDHTRSWAATIESLDGFVFVVPEYNHSFPGALKTAIDFLYAEWRDKPAGFVSYGVEGGVRAVEQLRQVAAELGLAAVQAQVPLSLGRDIVDGQVTAGDDKRQALEELLGQLVTWGAALRAVRVAA
jgi:NAD(P)H-dependent FMN reductase